VSSVLAFFMRGHEGFDGRFLPFFFSPFVFVSLFFRKTGGAASALSDGNMSFVASLSFPL